MSRHHPWTTGLRPRAPGVAEISGRRPRIGGAVLAGLHGMAACTVAHYDEIGEVPPRHVRVALRWTSEMRVWFSARKQEATGG